MKKYHNSVEIKDRKAQLKKKANEIIERCKSEVRDLQEDEKSELDSIKAEIIDLNTQLSDLEKRLKNLRFDDEDEAVEDTEENEDKEVSEDDADEENNTDNNTEKRNMKKKAFSLVRSIRNIVNNAPMNDIDNAVISAGNEQARKAGINFQGQIQLPSTRAAVTVTAEGEDVVATELFDILKPLRAKTFWHRQEQNF